ncbi:mechanosensitive ion channel family protein [Candidatus Halobeggiatoa sp. HSG11]|nr:mechanosensitive ion channel family protein [Candidatus Halobeggiatoa sp. HSG11]
MFEEHAVKILIFSIIFISLVNILNRKFRHLTKLFWFVRAIFTAFILITGEIFLTDWLAETTLVSYVKAGFDILWWLIPAYLIHQAMEGFIWPPIEEWNGPISNLIHIFVAEIIYSVAILGIIIFIYDSSILPLIVLFIAVVISVFFIKINLSSIIIDSRRLFLIGEWVKIAEFEEGEVVDITWRTVRIKTRDECIISIPSDVVLQSVIKLFQRPDNVYWSTIKIKVSGTYPQERVKKVLLDTLLNTKKNLSELPPRFFSNINNIPNKYPRQCCEDNHADYVDRNFKILLYPSPIVFISNIDNGMVEYTLTYCIDDYADKYFLKEEVFTRILHHLKQANISQIIESQPN